MNNNSTMLKRFKQAALMSLQTAGVSTLVQNSRWRRQRLLMLVYHGIRLSDEHLWNGSQFISTEVFRTRLRQLRKSRCKVLPLGEAIERLSENDLADRAVAMTFDDGTSDFYRRGYTRMKEFEFPETIYLTTFFSHYNRPVFDLMCSYLLWKGRTEILELKPLTGEDLKIELRSSEAREFARLAIHAFARTRKLSAEEKDVLLANLAGRIKVDYDALIEQRVMHNLRPDEVSQLAADGADIQLHTHRHRTPGDRALFIREIADNRRRIQEMTGSGATRFCYPPGSYRRMFLPWLPEADLTSGPHCETGFASQNYHRLLRPRCIY